MEQPEMQQMAEVHQTTAWSVLTPPFKTEEDKILKNPKYKRWSSWCLPNGGWCGPFLASDAYSKVWNGPRCCSSAPTQKNNDSHLYFRINPLVVQRFVRGIYEKHSFTHRSNCILGVECFDFSTQKNLQEEIQSSNYRVSQPGISCGAVSPHCCYLSF